MFSELACLEKSAELSAKAELQPADALALLTIAKAWREVAAMAEWQERYGSGRPPMKQSV